MAKLRHIRIARQAMVYWQTYDAFARISMSIGVIELLLAMSFYVLGYVIVEDNCRTAATYGVIVLTGMSESTVMLDMSLSSWEAFWVMLMMALGPLLSTVAAFHWSDKANFDPRFADALIVIAFVCHGAFLAVMTRLCRITVQDNGTMLPVAFRSVL
jgi:hypothetical protein